ncbi:NADPH:quinone oxidoreductase family protein [Naumannella halotolerans]|uniref:NADPH2:quinone reductase n=1 Tax=Naumannella halotolerans TaxID=993414 RepID=A0A4R7J3P0_9ACTN|nr:NADPH:quinone oxidoreductase family protein [Naumannella halotolerans]TDT30973.1 NADPH2:quinone reductase [Naumannella halotolerans]
MKALQLTELGVPSDALHYVTDAPVPEPGPGQVRVRVAAAPANFPDVLMCQGLYQDKPPLPAVLGIELAGLVDAVGPEVDRWSIGDRVIALPELAHGGFAEYALAPADQLFAAPQGLDAAQAASLTVAYQTAWFALHRRARLQPGEVVLVHAAAGGVGSATVELAKAAGAQVIAVVGGERKAEVARSLGADLVVDRTIDDFVAATKEFTGGRGADVIFDPVGGDTYRRSTKCIAWEGRILIIGFAGGQIQEVALNHVLIKNYSILGLVWGRYRQLAPETIPACHVELSRLAAEGSIHPVIDSRLSLAELPQGLMRLAAGDTVGRVAWVDETVDF